MNEGTRIVNFTGYNILALRKDGVEITFPADPISVRVTSKDRNIGDVSGVPLIAREYSGEHRLPEPQENTYFIVTKIVAQTAQAKGLKRTDLIYPDTKRNKDGSVSGAVRFISIG